MAGQTRLLHWLTRAEDSGCHSFTPPPAVGVHSVKKPAVLRVAWLPGSVMGFFLQLSALEDSSDAAEKCQWSPGERQALGLVTPDVTKTDG